jgi:predicted TIM-barrel fold metal-dependent hydrolase
MAEPSLERAKVVDGHCHVASTRFIPVGFLADVAAGLHRRLLAHGQAMSEDKILAGLVRQHQDHTADQLVREMDKAGIAQAVLLAPDFSQVMDCELTPGEVAAAHFAIKQRHSGRFHVFGGIDPRTRGGALEFESWLARGWVDGLKLYPPCGYSPSDARLFSYYEVCARFGAPVLTHVGPTARRLEYGYAVPELIDEASRKFPSVNFILAHGGVTYTDRCVGLCRYRENVYLDFAGFTGAFQLSGWQKALADLFRMGVNHKVIFGTDWPIFRMSGGLQRVLGQLCQLLAEAPDQKMVSRILGGTISALVPRSKTGS